MFDRFGEIGGKAGLTRAFAEAGLWLSLVAPSLAGLVAVAAVEAMRVTAEQRQRRRLERQRNNLARYFAPSVVERLARADRPAELERTQDAAVMFVDIVGFTRLSEPMPPAEAMTLLREFHLRVEQAVFAEGGMVEKFAGDGALACFGVPDPDPAAAAQEMAEVHQLATDALRDTRSVVEGYRRVSLDTELTNAANVLGQSIYLDANGAGSSIGSFGNDFEIDSRTTTR